MNPKLTFFGGVGTPTGANILLEFAGKKILIDCGLLQGLKSAEKKNFESFVFNPAEIDFVLVTHAHMDHVGRIPKLVREGFGGKIISTKETMELSRPMLLDSMNVIKEKHGGRELFGREDIEKSVSLWEGKDYGEKIELFPECSLIMQNAGHILGSAVLNVEIIPPAPLYVKGGKNNAKKIAFTGDLGNSPSPLLPDTEFPEGSQYIVMESVYGDRNHEDKKERRKILKEAILEGIKKDGTIIIPAFSIERTQVLLYEINNMVEDKEIPEIPVFLDSPLALKVTDIYKKYSRDFKESVRHEMEKGDDIFNFPGLKIIKTAEESKEIENVEGPKIIIAGSGTSEGGRVVNHEIAYLPNPNATIILVGYQPVGTLGRMLEDGAKEIERLKEGKIERLKIKAKIEKIKGYSSHMDSEHLLEFVEKSAPQKVFVIMGEPKSSLFLCQRIREYLDIEAVYPEEGRVYEL